MLLDEFGRGQTTRSRLFHDHARCLPLQRRKSTGKKIIDGHVAILLLLMTSSQLPNIYIHQGPQVLFSHVIISSKILINCIMILIIINVSVFVLLYHILEHQFIWISGL
jgi:hypothetical protein